MEENPYKAPVEVIPVSQRTLKLLPHDSFVLHISAPAFAVMERLEKHVYHLGEGNDEKAFAGELTSRGFTVYRLRSGARNAGRPTLCGRLEAEAGGTRVRVRMLPVWFTIFFLLCWFGLCCALVIGDARLHGLRTVTFVAPASIFLFVYLLVWVGFWLEAPEAKRTLIEILMTQPRQQPPATEIAVCKYGTLP